MALSRRKVSGTLDRLPAGRTRTLASAAILLGGLASSGWQTGGLSLRMLVDSFLSKVASAGGLGFTDLKWKNPVMVGDTIGGTVTIADLRRSGGHPQWGIMTLDFDVRNQKEQPVLTMRLANLIDTRGAGDQA